MDIGIEGRIVGQIQFVDHTQSQALGLEVLRLGPQVVFHEPAAGHLGTGDLLERHDLVAFRVDLEPRRGAIHGRGGENLQGRQNDNSKGHCREQPLSAQEDVQVVLKRKPFLFLRIVGGRQLTNGG